MKLIAPQNCLPPSSTSSACILNILCVYRLLGPVTDVNSLCMYHSTCSLISRGQVSTCVYCDGAALVMPSLCFISTISMIIIVLIVNHLSSSRLLLLLPLLSKFGHIIHGIYSLQCSCSSCSLASRMQYCRCDV